MPTLSGRPWRVAGLLAAGLFVAAVLPSPSGRRPEFDYVGPDKLLHLLGHGGFAAALAAALDPGQSGRRGAGVVAVAVSAGYGVVLGRLQRRVPGRVDEPPDVAAGVCGAVLGALAESYVRGDPAEPT